MNEPLLVDLADGVLRLTLNRPDKLNALTWNSCGACTRSFSVRRSILRSGSWCSRAAVAVSARAAICADRSTKSDPIAQTWASDPIWNSIEQKALQVRRYNDASLLLHTMGKPTIAMVRGATAGAGLCLAAACDFRIVSESAFFTTVFVKSGRSGDYGGSYLLHHLVGPAKAPRASTCSAIASTRKKRCDSASLRESFRTPISKPRPRLSLRGWRLVRRSRITTSSAICTPPKRRRSRRSSSSRHTT
jgi:enoyl-CoA hydratase/carnithine racemase